MSLRQAPGPYGLGPTDSWISAAFEWLGVRRGARSQRDGVGGGLGLDVEDLIDLQRALHASTTLPRAVGPWRARSPFLGCVSVLARPSRSWGERWDRPARAEGVSDGAVHVLRLWR